MKETKLKRLIKKMMDSIFLDAMTPEFKAANAELLKAIKMNDKSGAVPHADLEAVNKAMKANDAEKVGTALKKVQLQFSTAEKKLDDEVKDVTARLAEAKKAVEKSKTDLKASKADAALFDKARKAAEGIKANPRNASKLSPITDKLKKYGDLSKRVSQIVTLASSNKDVSKQVDMFKKAIDTAEKKYKKEAANVEKEAKKAKDELDVLNMRVKVTQGKKDAFQKERLYLANAVKHTPGSSLAQTEHSSDGMSPEKNKAISFIENDIAKEMQKQIKIMKEKQKKYYENAKDYSADLKEANRRKEDLLSAIKELSDESKKLGLNGKSAQISNSVAALVKKGDPSWGAPNEVKNAILRSVGRKFLTLPENERTRFKGLAERVRVNLLMYQNFINHGDFDRTLQLLSGGRKDIVNYMKTKEGNDAYKDAFLKISSLAMKIRNILPNFRPRKEAEMFEWDYFKNPKPFISALVESVKES